MIVKINTHPIVVSQHEEYHINWCGKVKNIHPKTKNGMPVFFIKSRRSGAEVNTTDMKKLEEIAKKMTNPCGKGSVTTDKTFIYIVEENGEKILLGTVTHRHIRDYRRMFDNFEYI